MATKRRELAVQILFWLLGALLVVSVAMAGAWGNGQNRFKEEQQELNRAFSERLGGIEAQLQNLSTGQRDLKGLIERALQKN